jgi:glycerol-3-phosphate acyltransferase PlsY
MLFAGAAAAMIIWQHRDNIQRLIKGNERRLGTPATPVE